MLAVVGERALTPEEKGTLDAWEFYYPNVVKALRGGEVESGGYVREWQNMRPDQRALLQTMALRTGGKLVAVWKDTPRSPADRARNSKRRDQLANENCKRLGLGPWCWAPTSSGARARSRSREESRGFSNLELALGGAALVGVGLFLARR